MPRALPERDTFEAAGGLIHIVHNLDELDLDPAAARIRCVVSGHSHQPRIEEKDGVLFVNPGSAEPRRFSLPVTVARIRVAKEKWSAEILPVPIPPKKR